MQPVIYCVGWMPITTLNVVLLIMLCLYIQSNQTLRCVSRGAIKHKECVDVSCARKSDFIKIGGYDEQLTGWGYEELDFCKRLEKTGINMIELPYPFLGKIQHTDADRFKNYPTNLVEKLPSNHICSQMNTKSNYLNFKLSEKNIKRNKFIANKNSDWGII